MATDVTVNLENRPGTLAELADAFARAGINIEGGCGLEQDGRGVLHLLVEDINGARRAIRDAGLSIQGERPVLVMKVEDRPGELARITRRLADAGVNIDLMYLATDTRAVLGVDDIDKVRGMM